MSIAVVRKKYLSLRCSGEFELTKLFWIVLNNKNSFFCKSWSLDNEHAAYETKNC